MTTAIQPRNEAALALWNHADVALVRKIVAEKANDEEFRLLIHLANKYQLDPLAKQIYCLKYSEYKPASIFAGLAGFVTIAERTGKYGGISTTVRREDEPWEVEYTHYDNGQKRKGTYKRDYQWVATATVWRTDAAHPFEAQVWESEYSSGRDLWTGKPRTMTTKVAMCQALRLAFSISGLYDQDEIKEAPAPASVNPQTGEIIDSTAREVPADAGRAVAGQDARPRPQATPNAPTPIRAASVPAGAVPESDTTLPTGLPTGIVINPGKALATQAFKRAASTAGLSDEEQKALIKQTYPNRGFSTLTEAEWHALEQKCRAMYSDVPAPEEAPIF